MVAGMVNILFSSMSTGLREEGATVSNRVFSTPNASGESRCICKNPTYKFLYKLPQDLFQNIFTVERQMITNMQLAFSYLLLGNHGKYDISNLSGKSLPFVLILFVTLLQYKDEHLQHLNTG